MKIKDENGFTLVELMVVLVIIIVVIGLGIGMYFANLPHIRLTAATREFRDNLVRAQSIAARENATVRVTLTATGYEIVRIVGAQDPYGALTNDVIIKSVNFSTAYKNAVNLNDFTVNDSLIFGKLGAVESSASSFTTSTEVPIDYCNGEFRVNIERADSPETMRVCINNEGRIRIQ